MSECDSLPQWWRRLEAGYHSSEAHIVLLHGIGVTDLVSVGGSFNQYLEMALSLRLSGDIQNAVWYSRHSGFTFGQGPNAERWRQAFSLTVAETMPPTPILPGQAQPSAQQRAESLNLQAFQPPGSAFPLLDRVLRQQERKFAVVVEFPESLVPESTWASMSGEDRMSLETLLAWAQPEYSQSGSLVILVTRNLNDLHSSLRAASAHILTVEVPYPNLLERARWIERQVALERWDGIEPSEAARLTAGMGRLHIEDVALSALLDKEPISRERIATHKRTVVKAEFGDVLDPWDPEAGFESIGGSEHVKEFFRRQLIEPIRRGDLRRVPKGVLLLGGSGCLHADTPIYDPVDGTTKRVVERYIDGTPFHVHAMDATGEIVVAHACAPWKYDPSPMIEFTTEDGQQITVTPGHRFWTGTSWMTAGEVYERRQQSLPCPLRSISDSDLPTHPAGVPRSTHTPADSPGSCWPSPRPGDAPLLPDGADAPASPLQPSDAPEHTRAYSPEDGLDGGSTRSHPNPTSPRHASTDSPHPSGPAPESPPQNDEAIPEPDADSSARTTQSPLASRLAYIGSLPTHHALASILAFEGAVSSLPPRSNVVDTAGPSSSESAPPVAPAPPSGAAGCDTAPLPPLPSGSSPTGTIAPLPDPGLPSTPGTYWFPHKRSLIQRSTRIVSEKLIESQPYFDFHVPGYENYVACGLVHHNTGKSLTAKAVASEAGMNAVKFDPAKVFDRYVGSSERNIRRALDALVAFEPVLVFIDEIDQMGLNRGGEGNSGTSDRVFGMLLEFMAREENRGRVCFLAASNRPDLLDAALKRPGRFDKKIVFGPPDASERALIFAMHLNQQLGDVFATPENIAEEMQPLEWWTGAELEALAIKAVEVFWEMDDHECDVRRAIQEALRLFRPTTQSIREQTLLALAEVSDLSLLPPQYRDLALQPTPVSIPAENPPTPAPKRQRRTL